jgi:hypothetical protein
VPFFVAPLDIGGKLVAIRHFLEDAFALLDADLDPSWHSNLLCQLQSLGNTGLLLGLPRTAMTSQSSCKKRCSPIDR